MRKLTICTFVIWFFLAVFVWSASGAPFLACDIPEPGVTIAKTEVEITKVSDGTVTVVSGLVLPEAVVFKLLDLAGLPGGSYKFRARWADATGFWSEQSPFLSAGRPAPAVGLRVVP
jgi:hypothetical protein